MCMCECVSVNQGKVRELNKLACILQNNVQLLFTMYFCFFVFHLCENLWESQHQIFTYINDAYNAHFESWRNIVLVEL